VRPAPPELAVVVLSYRNEDTILAAVDSLLEQAEPLEIVVCHSGGGPTPNLLRELRPSVRVLESNSRWFPGAARNAGVAATRAPIVAFLAGDCVALPGWAAGRIARHRAGARAVASAALPVSRSAASVASALTQYSDRLPHHRAPAPWRRFAASYDRALIDACGPFPENIAFGEDPAFNDRLLTAGVEIEWAPEVVAAHHFPVSLAALVSEHYRRGRNRGGIYRDPLRRALLALGAFAGAARGLLRAGGGGTPFRPLELARALPPLLVAATAATAGTLRGGQAMTSGPELSALRRRAWFHAVGRGQRSRLGEGGRRGIASGGLKPGPALDESG
jgi:GT2 family glycosyltransferase